MSPDPSKKPPSAAATQLRPAGLRVAVAVPVPLRQSFSYGWPFEQPPVSGQRVQVPFGKRTLVGVVLGESEEELAGVRVRNVAAVVDDAPVLDASLMRLLRWASDYYHHPVGDVVQSALPAQLRGLKNARPTGGNSWCCTPQGYAIDLETLKRAPARRQLLQAIQAAGSGGLAPERLRELSTGWTKQVAALVQDELVQKIEAGFVDTAQRKIVAGPDLSEDQLTAVDALTQALGSNASFLLHGVTGSGKTEVYIGAIREALNRGCQALVLVPEIALTPQLVERLESRLGVAVAVLHSGLSDSHRHRMWFAARTGEARVVLGTRSAVFAPLAKPGLIVIDEEHDGSYKQQDGFRYHGRDVAVMRARLDGVPIVLGSATPALETMENARRGRYTKLDLPFRVGAAGLPTVRLLDLTRLPAEQGLTPPLVDALADRLKKGEQSLVFLNRRGFSPVIICGGCRWQALCEHCDARLTYHRSAGRMHCHHCGARSSVPEACPTCEADALISVGEGTQRVEEYLEQRFPEAALVRLDRDAARGPEALNAALERIRSGEADIIVGTQMVAKGHDFPGLTLVGIINGDQGLYSIDFRASESLLQQITQVTGRAGRADAPGEVLVQTAHPNEPTFTALKEHDYEGFLELARSEREAAGFPPFGHIALLRCESPNANHPLDFLGWTHRQARALIEHDALSAIELMDPVPSPMERRAGRFRAQLLVRSSERPALHHFLSRWIGIIEDNPKTRKVRWSVDIDPLDLY